MRISYNLYRPINMIIAYKNIGYSLSDFEKFKMNINYKVKYVKLKSRRRSTKKSIIYLFVGK